MSDQNKINWSLQILNYWENISSHGYSPVDGLHDSYKEFKNGSAHPALLHFKIFNWFQYIKLINATSKTWCCSTKEKLAYWVLHVLVRFWFLLWKFVIYCKFINLLEMKISMKCFIFSPYIATKYRKMINEYI